MRTTITQNHMLALAGMLGLNVERPIHFHLPIFALKPTVGLSLAIINSTLPVAETAEIVHLK
ncbi:hypothetical protein EBQ10_09945 [Trueperella pyogenes]|uniref:Uncharacterized protein n=1 Tax=Trueperella pyogenes TaxID=1661 RepID=A0A3Q9GJR2_9ACTO|nr:hypothetical protein DC090_01195 [Trueperella pyogenes]AWG15899.1 hypothetical protein DDE06_03105 [Trueperella pyogenes]AZR04783.1 hypothetical protein EBQ11_05710 [Trueperella pyogenes]AZR07572.1 hypothetical protein EBQ10_09945 [Trueperella pyogenes]